MDLYSTINALPLKGITQMSCKSNKANAAFKYPKIMSSFIIQEKSKDMKKNYVKAIDWKYFCFVVK
ncbi:hypothetical protein LX99_03044 [Mucilaginibacter oryzae]|uniref:Uncharacterized protein n=1 Tax=Mucilaginibacter oryzae TaxID=468058 RepID=A0A316HAA8_9SPHI|nr:hypothetical protein LX99_03044 [Mucilaginibacter oryzae]